MKLGPLHLHATPLGAHVLVTVANLVGVLTVTAAEWSELLRMSMRERARVDGYRAVKGARR